MSVKDVIINKVLPKRLSKYINDKLEVSSLNKIPKANYSKNNLRYTTKEELDSIFVSKEIYAKWKKEKINSLELPEFTGGVNLGDQRTLYYLISYFKPQKVLEIGTHIGCSTAHIAMALKSSKLNSAKLVTVDIKDVNDTKTKPWTKFNSKYSPCEIIEKIDFEDSVKFVTQSSTDFLKNCQERFDFIFLDGSHYAPIVYQEIPYALNLLNKNGLILLHDYFPNNKPLWTNGSLLSGPYLAVKRLSEENHDLKVLPLGSMPWQTKLNSTITSLAIMSCKESNL